jgi:hypothetical protein
MTQQVRKGYRNHRKARWAAMLAVVVSIVAVFTVVAGSAATNTKPYTAFFSQSATGGSSTSVNLRIANLSSNQSLGSANVIAATLGSSGPFFTIVSTNLPSTQATVDSSVTPNLLKLRNLNIPPSPGYLDITINVTTPCTTGPYKWGILAKQSNDFNGPPGNAFTFQATGSNLLTTVGSTDCKLVWVDGAQPASTNVNTRITGSPYNASGTKVSVQAVDGNNNPITTASGTAVTLAQIDGSFSSSGTGFTGTTAQLDAQGVATFSGFMSDRTGSGFIFQGQSQSAGFVPTPLSTPPFAIANGVACDTTGCPTFNTTIDKNSNVDAGATGNSFHFLAINNATIPPAVTQPGGGCDSYTPAGGAFEAIDGRTTFGGELRFTYSLSKTALDKLYSSTQGQQFVPLCAGAAKLSPDGTPQTCTNGQLNGWTGKSLTNGRFDASFKKAVCYGGLYWGILSSFQDYNKTDTNGLTIDPTNDPTVTGWGSGGNFRNFYVRVPAPWDWKMG